MDGFVGLLGIGVDQAGKGGLMTGSSHLLMGLTEETFQGTGVFGTFPDAVINDLNMVEGEQNFHRFYIELVCDELLSGFAPRN